MNAKGEPPRGSLDEAFEAEELRKREWRRREEMILCVGAAASMIISGIDHQGFVSLVIRFFG